MKTPVLNSGDLLSLVGQATKRKGDFLSQASDLAKLVKTPEKLEKKMLVESRILVKALRDKQIRWEEYSRSLMQKTLIAALCGVYLGAKGAKPKEKMEKAWPTVVGDMLPPLVKFLAETKARLDSGVLLIGDKTVDFADPLESEDFDPGEEGEGLDELEWDTDVSDVDDKDKKGKTWIGLFGRVTRYTVTPVYSFVALGEYLVKGEQGFKEMRRVAKEDRRTCADCLNFSVLGWQPIGSLPMPGRKCTCYDRCRCTIEYR